MKISENNLHVYVKLHLKFCVNIRSSRIMKNDVVKNTLFKHWHNPAAHIVVREPKIWARVPQQLSIGRKAVGASVCTRLPGHLRDWLLWF